MFHLAWILKPQLCGISSTLLIFLHCRKIRARAAGQSVSAIVAVSSTTSPSGPLQSPRDVGALSSSALTQCPPPTPGQAGANTCPVWPTKHSALSPQLSARHGTTSVKNPSEDTTDHPLFPLWPSFPPAHHAHDNINKQGWLDCQRLCLKTCIHSSWPDRKNKLYRQKITLITFFYLFARVLWFTVQWRCGLIMWNFLWFSVPKRDWAVFYTASSHTKWNVTYRGIVSYLRPHVRAFLDDCPFSHTNTHTNSHRYQIVKAYLLNDCNTFIILSI